jgi:hypothetical protein
MKNVKNKAQQLIENKAQQLIYNLKSLIKPTDEGGGNVGTISECLDHYTSEQKTWAIVILAREDNENLKEFLDYLGNKEKDNAIKILKLSKDNKALDLLKAKPDKGESKQSEEDDDEGDAQVNCLTEFIYDNPFLQENSPEALLELYKAGGVEAVNLALAGEDAPVSN